jgi:hypothetical protein
MDAPLCPKCGNPSPEKISERIVDESAYFPPPAGSPKETIYLFRCPCGATFTKSVKHDGKPTRHGRFDRATIMRLREPDKGAVESVPTCLLE